MHYYAETTPSTITQNSIPTTATSSSAKRNLNVSSKTNKQPSVLRLSVSFQFIHIFFYFSLNSQRACFVSFSTDRNKIHTVPSTSVDDRRCGNETDSVSWVMTVFIEGAVLLMAFGFIAILVIKLRRVTQSRDGSRGKFLE